MLSGKGLKDWEWISKTFPGWMVREMEGIGASIKSSMGEPDKTVKTRYSSRVVDSNEDVAGAGKRESYFPQPSFRATQLNHQDSIGVTSPSDLRRPREQSLRNVVEDKPATSVTSSPKARTTIDHNAKDLDVVQQDGTRVEQKIQDLEKARSEAHRDALARESSFIDEFLKIEPRSEQLLVTKDTTWRQTALQRRSPYGSLAGTSKSTPAVVPSREEDVSAESTSAQDSTAGPDMQTKPRNIKAEPDTPLSTDFHKFEANNTPARSTNKILEQLPENDIDFLSASDIRASMEAKRRRTKSLDARDLERQKLEMTFDKVHKTNEIDPMIKSQTINNQLVRRLERDMRETNHQPPSSKNMSDKDAVSTTATTEGPAESSIDRMRKWIEQSGAIFSSHFWQDPTEEADAKKSKLFFDQTVARIQKGRITMRQVIEDLEQDVPASKPLLKRLKEDESLLDYAIHALRMRSGSNGDQAMTPKKLRAIQTLRLKFQDTENELNSAYFKLQDLSNTEPSKNVSAAFKRRLNIASKILHKNANLTRYLIWSLQARLEDPDIDSSMLAYYKSVANSLLTLRDTQTALARLVDRAMLVHEVAPGAPGGTDFMAQTFGIGVGAQSGEAPVSVESSSASRVDTAKIRTNIATAERLASEVEAQKLAMRGLSDDGYAQVKKPVATKSFDERSPLAHSLFRPFGPVLKSLSKDTTANVESKPATAKSDTNAYHEEVSAKVKTSAGAVALQAPVAISAEGTKEGDVRKNDSAVDLGSQITQQMTDVTHPTVPEATSTVSPPLLESTASTTSPSSVAGLTAQGNALEDNVSEPKIATEQLTSDPALVDSSGAHLPTHYTILIHDSQTGNLSITTSTSGPPRDTSVPVPIHQALSNLKSPAKFIPFITDGLEVVTAKKDMLVLRDALDTTSPSSTRSFETVRASTSAPEQEPTQINPIDGTVRLSPTGYVGPEESQEQLAKEFDARREAAGRLNASEEITDQTSSPQENGRGRKKERGRGALGGVAKTAIWAAAVCYVVGVFGEIANGG